MRVFFGFSYSRLPQAMRGDDGAEGVLDDVGSESNARVDTLKVLSGCNETCLWKVFALKL